MQFTVFKTESDQETRRQKEAMHTTRQLQLQNNAWMGKKTDSGAFTSATADNNTIICVTPLWPRTSLISIKTFQVLYVLAICRTVFWKPWPKLFFRTMVHSFVESSCPTLSNTWETFSSTGHTSYLNPKLVFSLVIPLHLRWWSRLFSKVNIYPWKWS